MIEELFDETLFDMIYNVYLSWINCGFLKVFNTTLEPMIDDVMDGFEGTVFAYGQTGSGKTFTSKSLPYLILINLAFHPDR